VISSKVSEQARHKPEVSSSADRLFGSTSDSSWLIRLELESGAAGFSGRRRRPCHLPSGGEVQLANGRIRAMRNPHKQRKSIRNIYLHQGHLCPRQNRSQRRAHPPRTIAQLISPVRGETHHAAVRSPPPDPSERQVKAGPLTRIWPCRPTPVREPSRFTRASLAASALASGQGWPGEQVPSISRAAIPDSRTRGPSSHQIGPSPSQTCVGLQVNTSPAGTGERIISNAEIMAGR
jgi:hypothetical protein